MHWTVRAGGLACCCAALSVPSAVRPLADSISVLFCPARVRDAIASEAAATVDVSRVFVEGRPGRLRMVCRYADGWQIAYAVPEGQDCNGWVERFLCRAEPAAGRLGIDMLARQPRRWEPAPEEPEPARHGTRGSVHGRRFPASESIGIYAAGD